MFNKLSVISISVSLALLTGCLGAGGDTAAAPATTPNAVAAGVWQGTSSSGYTADLVVLPNNSFATIFGNSLGNGGLSVVGFDIGAGTISGSTFTATGTEYTSAGYVASGNVTATVTNNTSIIGSATYSTGTTSTFNLTPLTGFSYNIPASLTTIAGSWSGTLLGGSTTNVTINSTTGAIAGLTAGGCSFTGTITPSTVNAYTTSITIGASPCANPNTTVTGIGVAYATTGGTTQLIVEAGSGTVGAMFFAQR